MCVAGVGKLWVGSMGAKTVAWRRSEDLPGILAGLDAVLAFVARFAAPWPIPGSHTRAVVNGTGIVGTTLPWFGLIWGRALAAY